MGRVRGRRSVGTDQTPTSTYGLPVRLLADITGVHIDTARRWKRRGYIPGAHGQLVALRTSGDLGVLSKRWAGFKLIRDQLYTPDGWDVRPGEIRSIPLRIQQLRVYEQLFVRHSDEVEL